MTSFAVALAQVKRTVYGTQKIVLNKTTASVATTDTSVIFYRELTGLSSGSYFGMGDELMYVWSVDGPTKTATVERAMLGTTAVEHASGTMIEVSPRFSTFELRTALTQEIQSWEPTLYRIRSSNFTVGASDTIVDLSTTTDFLHPLEVYQAPRTGSDRPFPVKFRWARDLDPNIVASGDALLLDSAIGGTTVQVVYASKFNLDSTLDAVDLESDVGLAASMVDVAVNGAAWRVLVTQEIKRTDTASQGEPRLGEEVPPGHITQLAENLRRMRATRLGEEATKLRAAHPAKARYG